MMRKMIRNREYGDNGKSLKRKKFCKFTKGEHNFILSIPTLRFGFDKIDPEQYYKERKEEIINKGGWQLKWGMTKWYICALCGKKDYIHEKII